MPSGFRPWVQDTATLDDFAPNDFDEELRRFPIDSGVHACSQYHLTKMQPSPITMMDVDDNDDDERG